MIVSPRDEPNQTLLFLYTISVVLVLIFGLVSFILSIFTNEPILPFNEFLTVCMLILFWLTLLSVKNLKFRRYE